VKKIPGFAMIVLAIVLLALAMGCEAGGEGEELLLYRVSTDRNEVMVASGTPPVVEQAGWSDRDKRIPSWIVHYTGLLEGENYFTTLGGLNPQVERISS